MLKIVLLGAGSHSQANHLPALARYASEHPGQIELGGLCDLCRDRAQDAAERYGFARAYTDLDEMLLCERPDACVAVTPIPVTTEVAARVIRAGVPLLMEKPPGATVGEAREIVDLVERTGAQVMVSMNRRFDPALCAALDWAGDRHVEYVRGAIVRVDRREPEFMYGTAMHTVDAMRGIAGDVRECEAEVRPVEGVPWYAIRFTFESGALGLLEVLPTAGCTAETYELAGAGYRAFAATGEYGSGEVRCWEGGRLVVEDEPAHGLPGYVRNGAYDETVAFLSALREGRAPSPSPAEVLQSVELCHSVLETAMRGT